MGEVKTIRLVVCTSSRRAVRLLEWDGRYGFALYRGLGLPSQGVKEALCRSKAEAEGHVDHYVSMLENPAEVDCHQLS